LHGFRAVFNCGPKLTWIQENMKFYFLTFEFIANPQNNSSSQTTPGQFKAIFISTIFGIPKLPVCYSQGEFI